VLRIGARGHPLRVYSPGGGTFLYEIDVMVAVVEWLQSENATPDPYNTFVLFSENCSLEIVRTALETLIRGV